MSFRIAAIICAAAPVPSSSSSSPVPMRMRAPATPHFCSAKPAAGRCSPASRSRDADARPRPRRRFMFMVRDQEERWAARQVAQRARDENVMPAPPAPGARGRRAPGAAPPP
eukprot:CAMPEP_0204562584 /NCGR_PEP_ID=MMETSP0661-20131031/33834_1 /ASSEMBLY_ACC=CAM_ASM_000606 /TAXON_ID=109239 /ORGANISM="Alexandrium margalefi, Strain AMGDE01CS-322" /LENGTH=111 /DNA_ID=CAMNT_0051570077 /DNA_START=217 /DNA_END=549 /DNA_ORIENTATION=-